MVHCGGAEDPKRAAADFELCIEQNTHDIPRKVIEGMRDRWQPATPDYTVLYRVEAMLQGSNPDGSRIRKVARTHGDAEEQEAAALATGAVATVEPAASGVSRGGGRAMDANFGRRTGSGVLRWSGCSHPLLPHWWTNASRLSYCGEPMKPGDTANPVIFYCLRQVLGSSKIEVFENYFYDIVIT